MTFIQQVFSDNGTPSSSRIYTGLHTLAAIALLFIATIWNQGKLPDATIIVALGGFATVHYLVNRSTSAWQTVKTVQATNGNGNGKVSGQPSAD